MPPAHQARAVDSPRRPSTGCSERAHERLPAQPETVAVLRRTAVAFARRNGASERQCEDVALAVSEALTNAVVHAYAGRERSGSVVLDARMSGGALEVTICDEGIGMRPRSDSPGLGLGLGLIASTTERYAFEAVDAPAGVRVRMTFAIG